MENDNKNTNCLITMSANERIEAGKKAPRRKMLFDEFWHEGETCVLFARTGNGKSILGTQIANSIAEGVPIEGFQLKVEAQKVLYCDFETDNSLFKDRYSNESGDSFNFSENLKVSELDLLANATEGITAEEQILLSIKAELNKWPAKVLVIDNITAIADDMLKAPDVKKLTNKLKSIKAEYKLSMLVLAHTRKHDDDSKPINLSDMFGSSLLGNFCDSAFAIGKSVTDESIRYIIQQKQRRTEKKYGKNNVIVCRLEKPDTHVKFTFIRTDKESVLLHNDAKSKCSDAGKKASSNLTDDERHERAVGAAAARWGSPSIW
jgi:RecA-family ATPase